jgi:catechol 2,3-dioxygenase-like lactoylglutathione lyase family enzyme
VEPVFPAKIEFCTSEPGCAYAARILRTKTFGVVAFLLVVSAFGAEGPEGRTRAGIPQQKTLRNMLVMNEDNSHFFGSRQPGDMTLAGLHAFVDQYAGSAVTHLFLCPNAMRASFRSSSRDAIWDPVEGKEPQDLWPQNAKRLFEAGLDPYDVWIRRCREKGLSPWLSMRMNDVHSVDEPGNFMHSSFWRAHPEFWRVPHGSASPWVNRALNYAHAEVREHQLAFVRELLQRYDPDGLELDWMRFGYHLTPGRERDEGRILNDFVRAVRSLADEWSQKRGHPIRLAVRVPAHPDAAAGLGMDAVLWAGEGLVDLLVPCPFWTSSDFDIPVELWRERLGAAADRVTVAPGIEHNARPWPGGEAVANDLASLRGFAASAYQRGANSLYLFNWMDSQTRPVTADDYTRLVRDGLSQQAALAAPRRHPVCYRDTVPAGFPSGAQLPIDARAGGSFRIHIGSPPQSGKAWASIGLAQRDGVAAANFEGQLNDRKLETAENVAELRGFGGGTVRAVRFPCPLDALRNGYNEVKIRQSDGAAAQQIVWVEIRMDP